MKILQVNKFLYPQGGAETYFLELSRLLEKSGHEVVYFSQKNPKNISHNNEEYFVSNLDLEKFSFKTLFSIGTIFWSFSASRKITKLIKKENPDIVHVHNIYHQISPSILKAIKKFNLPIVMTVHDFKLIKPEYSLRADNKKILHKNSRLIQMILEMEFAFHNFINIYKKNVDLFLTPSGFVKQKLIEAGFDENKITVTPLFIENLETEISTADNIDPYILFFGRLHEGKGIDTLLNAFALIQDKTVKLKIVGNGPEENNLKNLTKKLNIKNRVEFVKHLSKIELAEVIKKSVFTVMPSRLHETFGLSVIESMAYGKPTITSRAGALTEIINDDKLLFDVNSVWELKEKIEYLIINPIDLQKLSESAFNNAKNFNSSSHIKNIIEIYLKQRFLQMQHTDKKRNLKDIFFKTLITVLALLYFLIPVDFINHDYYYQFNNSYPRTANLFWKTPLTMEEAKVLAAWDLVVLDMSAQNQSTEAIKYLRQLNPGIIILAYVSHTETFSDLSNREPGDKGIWHDFVSGIKPNWYLKTYEGKNISWWGSNISLNLCAKDPVQTLSHKDYAKGNVKFNFFAVKPEPDSLSKYLVNFLDKKVLATGLWDGLLFDNVWQEVAWVDEKIDIDNDINYDDITKINVGWHNCNETFFKELRARVGQRYLLVGNGVGKYSSSLNGRMLEGFPEYWENGWQGSMESYLENSKIGYGPRINIVNSDTDNKGTQKDFQKMRLGLTSALMSDGYYNFDFGPNLREHMWWYDEFDIDLGKPLSDAKNLTGKNSQPGLWQRKFENGIVYVNSSANNQTVKIPSGYKITDNELNEFKTINNTIKIPAQDGIILVKNTDNNWLNKLFAYLY